CFLVSDLINRPQPLLFSSARLFVILLLPVIDVANTTIRAIMPAWLRWTCVKFSRHICCWQRWLIDVKRYSPRVRYRIIYYADDPASHAPCFRDAYNGQIQCLPLKN